MKTINIDKLEVVNRFVSHLPSIIRGQYNSEYDPYYADPAWWTFNDLYVGDKGGETIPSINIRFGSEKDCDGDVWYSEWAPYVEVSFFLLRNHVHITAVADGEDVYPSLLTKDIKYSDIPSDFGDIERFAYELLEVYEGLKQKISNGEEDD